MMMMMMHAALFGRDCEKLSADTTIGRVNKLSNDTTISRVCDELGADMRLLVGVCADTTVGRVCDKTIGRVTEDQRTQRLREKELPERERERGKKKDNR